MFKNLVVVTTQKVVLIYLPVKSIYITHLHKNRMATNV